MINAVQPADNDGQTEWAFQSCNWKWAKALDMINAESVYLLSVYLSALTGISFSQKYGAGHYQCDGKQWTMAES